MPEKRFPCVEQPVKCRLWTTTQRQRMNHPDGTTSSTSGSFTNAQQPDQQPPRLYLTMRRRRKNVVELVSSKTTQPPSSSLSEFYLVPITTSTSSSSSDEHPPDNNNSDSSKNVFLLKSAKQDAYLTVSLDQDGQRLSVAPLTTVTTTSDDASSIFQWSILPHSNNNNNNNNHSCTITHVATGQVLCPDDNNDTLVRLTHQLESVVPLWNLEFLSGELLFVRCRGSDNDNEQQKQHHHIRCNVLGAVSLTTDCRGWEVWRFLEAGDDHSVYIQSWMHTQCYLTLNASSGEVSTSTTPITQWQVFKKNGGVVIRDPDSGRVLCWKEAEGERRVAGTNNNNNTAAPPTLQLSSCTVSSSSNDNNSHNAVWQLESAHQQQYTLHCADDNRSLGPFPWVSDNAKQMDSFQVTVMVDGNDNNGNDNGRTNNEIIHDSSNNSNDAQPNTSTTTSKVSLLALRTNQYVGVDRETGTIALQENCFYWTLSVQPNGTYQFLTDCLKDAEKPEDLPQHALAAVQHESTEHAANVRGALELQPLLCASVPPFCWKLEPILPRAVSSEKIRTFAAGTTLAVATTVAMPFAVAGVVGLIGTEMGLLANAVAVTLTGAEAIASVGVVGATAAICFRQSADTLSALLRDSGNNGGGEENCPYAKRPFCDWRSW